MEDRSIPDKLEKRASIKIVGGEDLAHLSTGPMTTPSYLTSMLRREEKGGRGVGGLHGAKGKDGWLRVEIRRIGILGRLRYTCKDLWVRLSQWISWQKAGVIAAVVGAIVGVLTLLFVVF